MFMVRRLHLQLIRGAGVPYSCLLGFAGSQGAAVLGAAAPHRPAQTQTQTRALPGSPGAWPCGGQGVSGAGAGRTCLPGVCGLQCGGPDPVS